MSEEPVKIRDIVEVLNRRGQYVDAFYYGMYIPLQIEAKHGIPFERVQELTVDEVIALMEIPAVPMKYRAGGWNFYWGKEAFRDAGDED